MPRNCFGNRNRLLLKCLLCLVLNLAFSLALIALFSALMLKNPELTRSTTLIAWVCLGVSALVCGLFSVLLCRENMIAPPVICLLSGVLLLGVTLLLGSNVKPANFFVRFCVFSVFVLIGAALGILLQNRRVRFGRNKRGLKRRRRS